MNPGGGFRGFTEVAYLVFWWAAWSLADYWLLDYSPWSELVALALLGVGAALCWVFHYTTVANKRAPVELKESPERSSE